MWSRNKKTKKGIKFNGKYAIVSCDTEKSKNKRCEGVFIVKYGQKTKRCPKCRKQKSLKNLPVLETAKENKKIREKFQKLKVRRK